MTDVKSGIPEETRTETDPEETVRKTNIVIATAIGRGKGIVRGTETTGTETGTGNGIEAEIEEAKEAGAGSELGGTRTGAGCQSISS
jgi:hypothetical protein